MHNPVPHTPKVKPDSKVNDAKSKKKLSTIVQTYSCVKVNNEVTHLKDNIRGIVYGTERLCFCVAIVLTPGSIVFIVESHIIT